MHQKGLQPGDLVVGNSVWSLGVGSSVASAFKTIAGGEVHQITELIHNGRQSAFDRMRKEAQQRGGLGITGVSSELINHPVGTEFLSIGSCVRREGTESQGQLEFSTSADGQGLYCQLDCGFRPIQFVFGNVAYSIGLSGGVMGTLRSFGRGEVHEWSEIFNHTRHLALDRITEQARAAGANSVLGIQTTIAPFLGVQEMIMIGTASHHEGLPPEFSEKPLTSDLTNEEMWNVIHMGYVPIELVLGVSVYSIGVMGSFSAMFKSFSTGEIPEVTNLIYDARENALGKIARDAEKAGADDVVGIKTYIQHISSGIIEFMAVGTAVKKMPGIQNLSPQLPPQAIIKDIDTLVNTANTLSVGYALNK